jgi:hypothetical protein
MYRNLQPAKIARSACLVDRSTYSVKTILVSFVEIDIGSLRAYCATRKSQPFKDQMWTMLDENAILKASWFVLAGVAHDVAAALRALRGYTPFLADRKTCTTAATETRGRYLFKYGGR